MIFDLFNEPYPERIKTRPPPGSVYAHGGTAKERVIRWPGCKQLVTTIRNAGSTNIIMVGGVQYAGTLTHWLSYAPIDPAGNLTASWHNYNFGSCTT